MMIRPVNNKIGQVKRANALCLSVCLSQRICAHLLYQKKNNQKKSFIEREEKSNNHNEKTINAYFIYGLNITR